MTLGIQQLAMFASKNKQLVQIRIQVSRVEAVLERWSLPGFNNTDLRRQLSLAN